MTTETPSQELRSLLEETLRQAVTCQEEAMAGFIRAAALHMQICTRKMAEGVPSGAGMPPSAKPLADAAIAAARIAESLDELQRLAWEIARNLNVTRPSSSLRQPPAASEAAVSKVRFSTPEKAAPAWFASPSRRKK